MSGLECQSCGALLEVEPAQRTGKCLYCASPQVIERPPSADRPNPTFALGFVVVPQRALEMAGKWVRSAFFAPQRFRNAKVEDIRGLYVPAYLYTAAAHSQFQAEIGENYTVTETYTDSDGKTKTRTKTKTEWRSLQGNHAVYVSDHVVTASRGIDNMSLEHVEPFDLRALHRYTPKLISGWSAEEASLSPSEVVVLARKEAQRDISHQLNRFMPGDRHRNLSFSTQFHQEDLELLLVPIWVLPVRYRDDKPPVRLLVNGQTGKVHGKAPKSWVKIVFAVLFGLGLIAALVLGAMAMAR